MGAGDFKTVGQQMAAHRAAVIAADAAAPAVTDYLENPGGVYTTARVYATFTPAGGTNPTVQVQVWLKNRDQRGQRGVYVLSPREASSAGVATVTLPAGDSAFDVPVNGDDLFVAVEAVTGAPTSWIFECDVSWRGHQA